MHELNLYSAHHEGKSVTAEKFIKAAKAKNYKKRSKDRNFYLNYLNKLSYLIFNILCKSIVNQYNNTYHLSINKIPTNADYSALTEKIETNHKAPKFKVNYRVRNIKY